MSANWRVIEEIRAHIASVRDNMNWARSNLRRRAEAHDASKLAEPELSVFLEYTPKLKVLVYGSDEYKAALEGMGEGLRHHYEHNSHHPEHYAEGVAEMSLLDLIEMVCDWKAAAAARGKTVSESLAYSVERFGIEPQLASILKHTLDELWSDEWENSES